LFRGNFKSVSRIVGQDGCKVGSKAGSGNSVRTLFARRSRRKRIEEVLGLSVSQGRTVRRVRDRAAKLIDSQAIAGEGKEVRKELFSQMTNRGRRKVEGEKMRVRFVIIEFDSLSPGGGVGRQRRVSLGALNPEQGALKPEQGRGIAVAIHGDEGIRFRSVDHLKSAIA
jgi:hypothetical protein